VNVPGCGHPIDRRMTCCRDAPEARGKAGAIQIDDAIGNVKGITCRRRRAPAAAISRAMRALSSSESGALVYGTDRVRAVTSDTDVLVRVCVGALGLRSLPGSAGSQACSRDSRDPAILATNLLLEKLGVDDIRGTVHSLRADGMNVLRGAPPEDYVGRSRTSFANVKFVTRAQERSPAFHIASGNFTGYASLFQRARAAARITRSPSTSWRSMV
jgi:hypothetical protein